MKSFIAFLVISSLAISLSQVALPSGFTMSGCASVAGGMAGTNQCTQCNLNFVLTNQSTTCNSNACINGCNLCVTTGTTGVCLAAGCKSGWVFNSLNGACVDCLGATASSAGGLATGAGAGCSACTLASSSTAAANAVTCTTCMLTDGASSPKYYSSAPTSTGAVCLQCDAQSAVTVNSVKWTGLQYCQTCSNVLITNDVAQTPVALVSGPYVTCTGCYSTYGLIPAIASVAANGTVPSVNFFNVAIVTFFYNSVPRCALVNSATPFTATAATTCTKDAFGGCLNSITGTTPLFTASGANCLGGTFWFFGTGANAAAFILNTYVLCQVPASTYFAAFAGSAATYPVVPPATATTFARYTPATSPSQTKLTSTVGQSNLANCATGWLSTAAIAAANTPTMAGEAYTPATDVGVASGCLTCSSGYTLISSACVATLVNCTTQTSATTCTAVGAGFFLVSGTATACVLQTSTVSGSVCSGGCATGSFMAPNGTCITGTAISGCQYSNSTTFCVQCTAFMTNTPNCTACSTGCSVCTSATVCTNCSTGFTLSSAAACVSTAATTGKSANALLSGLAFISMIFYYIF